MEEQFNATGRFEAESNCDLSKINQAKLNVYYDLGFHDLERLTDPERYDGRKYFLRFQKHFIAEEGEEPKRTISLEFYLLDPTECRVGDSWLCCDREMFEKFKLYKEFYITNYIELPDKAVSEVVYKFDIRETNEKESCFVAVRVE